MTRVVSPGGGVIPAVAWRVDRDEDGHRATVTVSGRGNPQKDSPVVDQVRCSCDWKHGVRPPSTQVTGLCQASPANTVSTACCVRAVSKPVGLLRAGWRTGPGHRRRGRRTRGHGPVRPPCRPPHRHHRQHRGRRVTHVYVVTGGLFFASSNDLVTQFDYNGGPEHVIIDLPEAQLGDASTVAALDAITANSRSRARASRSSVSTPRAPPSMTVLAVTSRLSLTPHLRARPGHLPAALKRT